MQVFLGYPPEYVKNWIQNNKHQLTTGGKWTVDNSDVFYWDFTRNLWEHGSDSTI